MIKKSSKNKDSKVPPITQSNSSKTEKQVEFIPVVKKKSKHLISTKIRKSLMRLINKQKEKKSEDINKNEEEKEILEEDIDYEYQQNLIA